MSTPSNSNLEPDAELLAQIFAEVQPASTTILSQDYDTCVFIAHFNSVSEQISSSTRKDVVVRLGLPSSLSYAVSAMQRLGAIALPDLVPAVERIGTATMQNEVDVSFCVMSFVADAVALETVWDDMVEGQRADVMDGILSAVRKIQALDLGSESVREVLEGAGGPLSETAKRGGGASSGVLGSPTIGFFGNIPDLIGGIIVENSDPKREPSSNVKHHPEGDGIFISTANDEIHIPQAEVASLEQRVVFCHNDLEPRNVLVRLTSPSGDHTQRYELAAIIDWEMAGFFPFAYEYYLKDSRLGISNLSFSWYTHLKQRMASLVPVQPMARDLQLFTQAIDLVCRAREEELMRRKNVGMLFRARWIERERLELTSLASGWVRRADAGATRAYTKPDDEELEMVMLKELGYV